MISIFRAGSDSLLEACINVTGLSIKTAVSDIDYLIPEDEEYKKKEQMRLHIQAKTEDLARMLGLTKSVEIKLRKEEEGIKAHGVGLNIGYAGITIDVDKVKDKAQPFIIARQLVHIKNCDRVTNPLFTAVLSIVIAVTLIIFSPPVLPAIAIVGIVTLIGYVAKIFFTRWRENVADKEALDVCTLEEKQEAIKWLKYNQKINIHKRADTTIGRLTRLYRKMRFNSIGNDRLDWNHSSLEKRIHLIEDNIRKN